MSAPAPPHYTSVPAWAREPVVEPVDHAGTSHSVLSVGPDGAAAAAHWLDALGCAGARVRHHDCADAAQAVDALETDLADALVGHRVLVAGSAQACLAVRAAAVRAGLSDAELRVAVTTVDERSVWCVHCHATNSAAAELEDVLACAGCGRTLLVYPHVSRRTGAHLGFMVDAEGPA
ncbi:dimethylamine monooxygenase subunit DmmA family protein [Nocardioides acrostichi]|uniref:Dimethylamine monooxygenase subunit DmmA-like C-terminal domain-containing protein n=1 Tax=Nocardioides acrostichi TaxID=2784339 RepID=A0A930UYG0_9ACTN|nr:dimethylamine monooxygenase subunit DmmA family protein [Nocardioides acrostichi]MBF4162416.1 hypothetical protein [Nocardioides acrostichi]